MNFVEKSLLFNFVRTRFNYLFFWIRALLFVNVGLEPAHAIFIIRCDFFFIIFPFTQLNDPFNLLKAASLVNESLNSIQ